MASRSADDVREERFDCGQIPGKRDHGAAGDGGDCSPGCDAFRIERGENNGSECGGVDGVGPEHLLQNAFGIDRLIERPAAKQHNGETRNDEHALV